MVLIAETSANDVRYLLPPEAGGYGFDAVWADDFYWAFRRYATGDHEGRYQDYHGTLAEVAHTINQGFLYEGAHSAYARRRRGTPARQQPAWQFQYCLQHHDHVGNRAFGERLQHHLDLERYRVASAVLLLLPSTPLLFMGQEFVASTPFLFFTDHSAELGRRVAQGRRQEFAAYAAFADPAAAACLPDPQARETFRRSKLPLDELDRSPGQEMQCLYRELLWLRRTDSVLRQQDRHSMRAHAVTPDLLTVAWHQREAYRLLLANFGAPAVIRSADLVKEQAVPGWHVLLETSEPRFGGHGAGSMVQAEAIHVPARTAVFVASPADAEA